MRLVWIALGVVAVGGVGYGLWWALRPVSTASSPAAAPATAGPVPSSKNATASLPQSPTGGEEASTYVRTIGDALGAIGALARSGGA